MEERDDYNGEEANNEAQQNQQNQQNNDDILAQVPNIDNQEEEKSSNSDENQNQNLNQNEGIYENANQNQNEGLYENTNQNQNEGIYENVNQNQNEGIYENVNQNQNEGIYENANQNQNEGIYENANQNQNEGIYENANENQNQYQNDNIYENAEENQNQIENQESEVQKKNPMSSFLNIVNQIKKQKNIERADTSQKEEDFDETLLKECQREEEENEKKVKEKQLQEKIKKVKYYNFKDYFLIFMLFFSSSFNFNCLSMYYILVGLIYLILLENLSEKSKKIKYYLEIFTIGFASYSLLFKAITIILAILNYDEVTNNKELLINLGVSFLHDQNSIYYFILSIVTEITMIFSSGYGIFVSFTCRTLTGQDINFRRMKKITIRKLILISYIFMVCFSVFNISLLTLFYIILIQLSFLLSSLKLNEEKIKKLFKFIISVLLVFISIQLFLINFFNIPYFQDRYLHQNEVYDKKEGKVIKIYSIYTQIGISYSYRYFEDETLKEYLKKYAGYIFGVLSMLSMAFILGELRQGPDILSEEEMRVEKMKKKIEKHKELNKNNYIMNGIDEIIRVISIVWIYYFRNFYSVGIFFVVFFSFYFIDRKKNRCLILYLLLPMLFLTLAFSHIGNIDGFFEDLNEDRKIQLRRFAIEKYEYVSLEYLAGHAFYILLMFLINSLYYFPKVKEMIKNKNKIIKKEDEDDNKISNDAILPVADSNKSVDIAYSDRKNENDLLYEDVYEEKNSGSNLTDSQNSSDSSDDEKKESSIKNESQNQSIQIADEYDFSFTDLLGKYFFINIDKLTLVVMYFVSVYRVNLVHFILVLIFIMQIIIPKKMHYFYKINISIFQLLYFCEFAIDLLKIYFYDSLSSHKELLELFIIYNDDRSSNDIEIFIYAVVYCLFFQYRAYSNRYIANILTNKKISFRNYLQNFLAKRKKKEKTMTIKIESQHILVRIAVSTNDLNEHLYVWGLVIGFLFFSCYFEMNVIFLIKLILFFISLYYYIVSVQTPSTTKKGNERENINITLYRVINKIIILYCNINTLLVFLYQFLLKDFFGFQKIIKDKKQDNSFLLNLPTIGLTLYKEENLYYNFLPYFMTCFIFTLYKRKTKKILRSINNYLIIRKQTTKRQIKLLKEKKKKEEEKMRKIKEEQNEFIQDKLYADKYNENEKEIYIKSHQLIKANIILIFTKCYWLFLYFFVGVIFCYYELSYSMLLYIIIFGFFFIKMFYRIISKLANYIKKRSYFISKVVRYSLIEDPKHFMVLHEYRITSFRCLLIYSFVYFTLLYAYGLFDLFQHGCKEKVFLGCDSSHSKLVGDDSEDLIKIITFLFGIYINTQERNIIEICWIHCFVATVLVSDLYNQKLEENYRKKFDSLRKDLQVLLNENNVLEKYSRIIDYNILIKIGLTVAGIDLTPVKDKRNNYDFRLSLQKKFMRNPKELNKLIHHHQENNENANNGAMNNLKTIVEDISRSSSNIDDTGSRTSSIIKKNNEENNEAKSSEFANLDLNENSPGNEFLKNKTVKRFLNIFSLCNDNQQTLSVGNSKDRVMRFLKKLFEELIIFVLICLSLSKLSVYTFIYLVFTFYLISTKKTMYKFYVLSCCIFAVIIIQSLCFLSNINEEITKRDYDDILPLVNSTLGLPWYKNSLGKKAGFFWGVGASESQVHMLWLEFIQIILIFFYLDMFSYSIYQDILNLGQKTINKDKFDIESLNLKPNTIDYIKNMGEIQFQQYSECLKCFELNIGKDHNEFLRILKIKGDHIARLSDINENRKNKKKYNLEDLKNPTLKELIYFRLVNKENTYGNFGSYRPLPKYLMILQEVLYMYSHFFILILIILLSIMIGRLVSVVYVTVSFYYLINSELLYLGEKFTYFIVIKKVLRIVILIDILGQGIYQIPFLNPDNETFLYNIFNAIGFFKVIDFTKNKDGEEEITIDQSMQVFSKAIIYLLISLQILIYESSHFKKYYLVYLLENKNEFKRHSIINSFKFNNQRVKIFQRSLSIRQQSDQAMEDLKRIIEELNNKLKKIGGKLLDDISRKRTVDVIDEKEEDNINNINNDNNDEIQLEKNEESNIINAGKYQGILGLIQQTNNIAKEKNYLEVDEVKEKIKDMIYKSFITKVYLWLHKHSASYRSIEEEEKDDFDIETIKGETKIKSIIEHDVNRLLNITDLEHFDKEDLKSIELMFEAHSDEKKRILLEENKMKEERSKNTRRKFSNLYTLHKFAKMESKPTDEKKNEDVDILGFFKENLKKEKEVREQFEKEEDIRELRERYKFQQFEELLETNLFKKYLTKTYLLENVFYLTLSFIIHNFNSICYLIMILNHIMSASLSTLFYPISIICFALIEYPRPSRFYWTVCLYYTVFLMLIKLVIQMKSITIIVDENDYKELINYYLYDFKIGFKYYEDLFSGEFFKYIVFDALTLLTILINRNLLITDGIWYQREPEIENIYEASERIAIYSTKTYESKVDAIKDLLLQYLYSPKEILNLTRAERNNYEQNDEEELKQSYAHVKHRFPFILTRNEDPAYNEVKRGYFGKIFTKNRNEKPGRDFYASYTGALFLMCLYILVFYNQMVQDNTYGKINMNTTQFSGSMVLYLILHVTILVIDRIIFVSQNRDNLQYEYIFYKRNEQNQQGELLTEIEENKLKSEISKNAKSIYKITNLPRQEIEKQLQTYNIVFIQKETFNYPLLTKYIIHIFIVLFNHYFIFFYFPIKGNDNLGSNGVHCTKEEQCNNFTKNYFIWIFYLINLIYMLLSALQIKYGFYDIKRKSLFKKKQDELFSNAASLFKMIPFLYEIKNAIDWTFTHTCLDLFQWNKFEAIYDTIFDTYCEKEEWDEKPIGERVNKTKKFGIGFTLSFGLIFTLIIPLLLFSSLNPTNHINNINKAKINVYLTFNYKNGVMKNYNLFLNERADSISQMFKGSSTNSSESDSEKNTKENSTIWDKYKYSDIIETRNFNHEQVQRIIFSETSDRNWELAYPHITNLIKLLNITEENKDISSINININYEFERALPAVAQILKGSFSVPIYTFGDGSLENKENGYKIGNLSEAIRMCYDQSIILKQAYSPPIRLTSGREISSFEDEDIFEKKDVELTFLGCVKESPTKNNYFNSYFTFKAFNEDNTTEPIEFHIFNDQISETTQGYSVITFYVTFVLLVGSYVRDYLASEPETIMLEEMPHAKRIVDLCEGIKIARYGYDFRNEEYLYTILIELMRSPDYLKILTDSSLDYFRSREKLTKDDD